MFEVLLETYPLTAIKIVHESTETLLSFREATLFVDKEDIELAWFVDITNITNLDFLNRLSQSLHIQVMMYARTDTGLEIAGEGYFHPNLSVNCGTVKGSGELIGYEQIREAAQY